MGVADAEAFVVVELEVAHAQEALFVEGAAEADRILAVVVVLPGEGRRRPSYGARPGT